MSAADEQYMDSLERYNIEQDRYVNASHSGKGRSKREVEQNHYEDPNGHTRKTTQKLINSVHKSHEANKKS